MAGLSTMDSINVGMAGFNMFTSGLGQQISADATAADAATNATIAGLNLQKSNRNYMAQISEMETSKAINLDTNYASYIYGGLTMTGTPTNVQEKTESVYNSDISLLRQNMKTDADIYKLQQESFYAQAAAAEKSGLFGKISSGLGGALVGFALGGPAGAAVGAGVGLFA